MEEEKKIESENKKSKIIVLIIVIAILAIIPISLFVLIFSSTKNAVGGGLFSSSNINYINTKGKDNKVAIFTADRKYIVTIDEKTKVLNTSKSFFEKDLDNEDLKNDIEIDRDYNVEYETENFSLNIDNDYVDSENVKIIKDEDGWVLFSRKSEYDSDDEITTYKIAYRLEKPSEYSSYNDALILSYDTYNPYYERSGYYDDDEIAKLIKTDDDAIKKYEMIKQSVNVYEVIDFSSKDEKTANYKFAKIDINKETSYDSDSEDKEYVELNEYTFIEDYIASRLANDGIKLKNPSLIEDFEFEDTLDSLDYGEKYDISYTSFNSEDIESRIDKEFAINGKRVIAMIDYDYGYIGFYIEKDVDPEYDETSYIKVRYYFRDDYNSLSGAVQAAKEDKETFINKYIDKLKEDIL